MTNPIPMNLTCPKCGEAHIDKDEWATKIHKTHICEHCGKLFRPYEFPTVGLHVLVLTEEQWLSDYTTRTGVYVKISKSWAMPNKNTFSIKPIKEFIQRNWVDGVSVDPFANSNNLCGITNDLDSEFNTTFNMDALDFLKQLESNSVDILLYDPPYSPRQVSESYKKLGMSVNMETTQASYWRKQKDEIKRVVKKGGVVLSFGWSSGGIGKSNGFTQTEILLVAHGGSHNDTICVCEIKDS